MSTPRPVDQMLDGLFEMLAKVWQQAYETGQLDAMADERTLNPYGEWPRP